VPGGSRKRFPVATDRSGVFRPFDGRARRADLRASSGRNRFKTFRAAPIAAPSQVPWGEKAFAGFSAPIAPRGADYVASELVAPQGLPGPILVDQGLADQFARGSAQPELFEAGLRRVGPALTLRRHPGYDHGTTSSQTFVADHLKAPRRRPSLTHSPRSARGSVGVAALPQERRLAPSDRGPPQGERILLSQCKAPSS